MVTKARTLGSAVSVGGVIQRDGAIKSYNTVNDLPVTASSGDFAFVLLNQSLYIWEGSKWERIYLAANEVPEYSVEPDSTYTLSADGTPTTVTTLATDPEGFPISYTFDTNPANQSQATIVNNNDGTYTLNPSTNDSDAGDFSLRLKATDGLHFSYRTTSVSLSFTQSIVFNTLSPQQTDGVVYYYPSTSGNLNTLPLKTGKVYFEVILNTTPEAGMIGISIEGFSGNFNGDGGQNGWFIWQNTGNLYPGVQSIGISSYSSGNVIMLAYDTNASKVWFGRNGVWQSGGDPSTGQGGQSIATPGVPYQFMIGSGSGGGTNWNVTTTTGPNVGLQTYPTPTGFINH